MIREKTGKLINDRTQTFGLNFIDLMSLSVIWMFNSFILFSKRPLLSVIITGGIYCLIVLVRTSKRVGWVKEIVSYYMIKEILGGVYSERSICRNKKTS